MQAKPARCAMLDRVEGLGQRADLVDLDQQRAGGLLVDTALQPGDVGDEQVVADDLDLVADLAHQRAPAGPVVLGQRVLDGDDREVVDPLGVDVGHLVGGQAAALEGVAAVGEELGAGHVEGQGDVGAQLEAGGLDGGGDQLERRDVGRQVRREAALVAQSGGQALLLQHALERVVDAGTHLEGLAEGRRTDRSDHELLHVDVGVGVRAAVDDVHHRHRQHVGVRATDVAVERQIRRAGRRVRDGERDAEDRVGADLGLVVGAVQVEHRLVDQPLLAGVVAQQLRAELVEHAEDGLGHALAAVAGLVPVTQLDGLEGAGGGARRHCRATLRAVVQDDLDLYRGIAAGVEDLAGTDELNTCHVELPSVRARVARPVPDLEFVGPTLSARVGCADEAGRVRPAVHERRLPRLPQAKTAFTPTMPAQATITPRHVGSTLAAAIAVIGMPVPSETMPSTKRCELPRRTVGPILLGGLVGVPQLGRPVGDQLLDPVGQAGGDRVVVLRPSSERVRPDGRRGTWEGRRFSDTSERRARRPRWRCCGYGWAAGTAAAAAADRPAAARVAVCCGG